MIETVVPISARLIANRSGWKFKNEQITSLCEHIARQLEGQEEAK